MYSTCIETIMTVQGAYRLFVHCADVSHIAGKLSRRAFQKCIIRVVDVGKFGRRSGKAGFLTSSVCVNYDGASHFHSFPVPVTHQSFDWALEVESPCNEWEMTVIGRLPAHCAGSDSACFDWQMTVIVIIGSRHNGCTGHKTYIDPGFFVHT